MLLLKILRNLFLENIPREFKEFQENLMKKIVQEFETILFKIQQMEFGQKTRLGVLVNF